MQELPEMASSNPVNITMLLRSAQQAPLDLPTLCKLVQQTQRRRALAQICA